MKYIKSLKTYGSAINEKKSKADYNSKIGDLKDKIKETSDKIDEINDKLESVKDPYKGEILSLTIQKLSMKISMLKIDLELNKTKRSQL